MEKRAELPETTKDEIIAVSRAEYESLQSENKELAKKVNWLMEQMRLTRQKKFGASSEKSKYDCMDLFNEAEVLADEKEPEPKLAEVQSHYRKAAKQSKDRLPADLPVEVVEHFLEEDSCLACQGKLHIMGKEIRRELKLIPAQATIVEHVYPTYACRNCEANACEVPIIKTPMKKPVIAGSFASAEAVAHIMTQKFACGLPLYRQEQEWYRMGIYLSRQTMSNWLLRCSEDWLEPIYQVLHKALCQEEVLHADETVLQVLHEPGKAAQSKSYMWVYRTSGDAKMPIVLLEYQPDRKAKRPIEFLDIFKGICIPMAMQAIKIYRKKSLPLAVGLMRGVSLMKP